MTSGQVKRPGRRLAKTSLLPIIVFSTLIVVAAAIPVTVTKTNVAAYGGSFVRAYYQNQYPPTSGCTTPCLTVDTQTTEPSSSPPALALDGSTTGVWTAGTSFTITVSTTKPNDVVVLWILSYISGNPMPVASVADSLGKVLWQTSARTSYASCTHKQETTQTEWYGTASNVLLSDVVTITLGGTPTSASALEFAVSGANTVSPFDPNTSVPATVACSTSNSIPTVPGLSTSNTNDFIFALYGGYTSTTETVGAIAGTTANPMQVYAGSGDSLAGEYLVVSGTQVAQSCAFGTSTQYWGMVCDAIIQGSNSFTLPAGSSMYLWSPPFGAGISLPAGSLSLQLFADLPAPALDGSASGTWTTGTTFTVSSLTTTKPNDVVVLSIQTYKASSSVAVTSVSDGQSKIAWQGSARSILPGCSGTQLTTNTEWYGVAATAVTGDSIAVTLGSTPTSASGIAFGVSGADTVTPFDPSSTPPKTGVSSCTGTASTPTITGVATTSDTDLVFATFGGYTSTTETAGTIGSSAGLLVGTVAGTGDSNAVEYATTASAQSGTACSFGTATTYWGGICDALMPARQSVTVSYATTDPGGTVSATMITGSSATITALYQPISLPSASGSVPPSGYLRVVITAPSGAPLTVFWGSPRPTVFEVEPTVRTQ